MPTPKKFKKGKQITSLAEFNSAIQRKKSFYLNDKYQHYNWSLNWYFKDILQYIKKGILWEAIPIAEFKFLLDYKHYESPLKPRPLVISSEFIMVDINDWANIMLRIEPLSIGFK